MAVYRFDQIATLITRRVDPADTSLDRYVGLEHLDPESLKIRRWGTPSDVVGEKLLFWPGDIIYGKRRAYQRKLGVADFEGICSAHAMVLRAKTDTCLPEFLPFFMQSELFHQRALEISVGSLSPTINWHTLAEQEFPLPPLEEQRRIASLLQAVDEVIENKYRLFGSIQKLRDSVRENTYFASSERKVKLNNLCFIRYGLGQPPSASDSGVSIIRATNISRGEISEKDMLKANEKDLPKNRAIYLKEGDIILVRSGAYTGDSALITKKWENSVAGYDLVISPDKSKINPIFLAEFLLHIRTIKTILEPMSARTAQPHLNAAQVGSVEIVLPSLQMQAKEVETLENINNTLLKLKGNIELQKRVKGWLINHLLSPT